MQIDIYFNIVAYVILGIHLINKINFLSILF